MHTGKWINSFVALVIIIGLAFYFKRGKDAYGIDFVGGQLQEYSFKEAPDVEKVRKALKDINVKDASSAHVHASPAPSSALW